MMFRVVVACTLVAAGVSAPAAQVYTGEPLGESPEVCAARETLEETGITVSNVQFVAIGRCWPRAPANLPWGGSKN